MLLCVSSLGGLGLVECPVGVAGEVAFEAAADFTVGFTLKAAGASDIGFVSSSCLILVSAIVCRAR